MEEGEVMERLDGESCMAHVVGFPAEHLVGGEEKEWPYAFASEAEGVVDGPVELLRLCEELLGLENLLYFFKQVFHVDMFIC